MTEAEWQTCESPLPMLIFLRGEVPAEKTRQFVTRIVSGYGDLFPGPGQHISARKCRLFILACLQRLHELPLDEPSRQLMAVYQRYALGEGPRDEFIQASLRIQEVVASGGTALVSHLAAALWTDDPAGVASAAMDIACSVANVKAKDSVAVTCAEATEDDRFAWAFCGGPPDPLWQAARKGVWDEYPDLIREVVGNPFRSAPTIGPAVLAWEGGCVARMAATAYRERDFSPERMGVLADALEEAGYGGSEVLAHLRSGAEHVRGCWAVDALLGRS